MALLAALLFGEALGPAAVLGLALGVAGLLLLEVPEPVLADALASGPGAVAAALSGGAGGAGSVLESGEFFMLLAAQSRAVGTVMVR